MMTSGSIAQQMPSRAEQTAKQWLSGGVSTWVGLAMLGQWLFATYIMFLYALPIASGNPQNVNLANPITGYVADDLWGNLILFSHVIPAALLSIGGGLQLLPFIRKHYPVVHRFNGRMFLTLGFIGSASGLYLTWVRGSRLSDIGALGVTLNGILILVAVVLAWRFAIKRDFAQHKRWAIHSFLLINGVWFFRLYIMAWYGINQGPNGNTSTMDGPTDLILSYACYLVPMLIAEGIFWAQRQKQSARVWSVFSLVALGCVSTAIGILAATFMMWLPPIKLAIEAMG